MIRQLSLCCSNIGANGIVEVHQPEKYLQLRYYDDVKPKPGATLGHYYEEFSIVSDKGEYMLALEIGKLAKRDFPSHQRMWDNAISIIKDLAEKR